MRHASIGWEAKEERRCAAAEPRNPSIIPIYRILQSASHGVQQATGEGEDGSGTGRWDGPTMAGFGLVGDVDRIPCFTDENACWFHRAMGQLFFMGKSRSLSYSQCAYEAPRYGCSDKWNADLETHQAGKERRSHLRFEHWSKIIILVLFYWPLRI